MTEPKYIHVMPEDGTDVRDHIESPSCWCNPKKDKELYPDGNEVYVHEKFLPENEPRLAGIAND